jgi:Uma2 family endonuclease
MTAIAKKPTEPLEPAWDIAKLFPPQGTWTEGEYLAINANRIVEFSEGTIEVLDMPTTAHQMIVAFLYGALLSFVSPGQLGRVLFAPLRVKLWERKFREPDVVFMLRENARRIGNEYWDGADLVMEVVSDDDRRRDLEIKRKEYAKAGIREYWIADPQLERVTVLVLEGNSYKANGEFARGQTATSRILSGFTLDVNAVFDSARLS